MNFSEMLGALREECNILFGKVYSYNYQLMKKSEDLSLERQYQFDDIFSFYISSHAQSWLKNFYYGHWFSPGMMLNSRCILEGLAIKKMREKGDITDEHLELLQVQVFLIEYNNYKNFSDVFELFLIPEKLKEDWERTVAFFQEKLASKFDADKIKKITKSGNPFLCDDKLSYHKIVERYLGEEYAAWYGVLSQCAHPSSNLLSDSFSATQFVLPIWDLVVAEYGKLPFKGLTLGSYIKQCTTSVQAHRYYELIEKQCDILQGAINVMEKHFPNNYFSNTFQTVITLLREVVLDHLLGLNEQVKAKWKIVLDLLASFDFCYIGSFPRSERYDLLVEHTRFKYAKNMQQEYDLSNAYDAYRGLYPSGVERERFEKAFSMLVGYTVNEKGNVKNLSELVRDFVKNFEKVGSWSRVMCLDYAESQMISHANGYMWFANSGAWGDVNNILMAADISIDLLLQKTHAIFKLHALSEEDKTYKDIVNVLRNASKKLRPVLEEKAGLQQEPKQNYSLNS